jgi:transposase InsO family protein
MVGKARSLYVAQTDGKKISPSQDVCQNDKRCFSRGPGRYEKPGIILRRLVVHTCSIDVFSRYSFVVPVKDKRGLTVSVAFGKIFADSTPNMLQTDRGLGFLNAQVQEVFRKNNVYHYYSFNDDIKAALVERFSRTLKSRLYRYMTHHRTNRWIDALDDVVKSYNSSYHRSIGTTPNDVTPGKED